MTMEEILANRPAGSGAGKPSDTRFCFHPETCGRTRQCEIWLRSHVGCHTAQARSYRHSTLSVFALDAAIFPGGDDDPALDHETRNCTACGPAEKWVENGECMRYAVLFDFSWCLAKTLTVPAGFKAAAVTHVEEVERILNLKRQPPYTGTSAVHPLRPDEWNPRYDWADVDDDLLCKTVDKHNVWVRQMYAALQQYAETPFAPNLNANRQGGIKSSEELTPLDAREFWHGLRALTVPPERWNRDYYIARMVALYEVMRGRPTERLTFDAKPLTQQQAGEVIQLFESFLDPADARLQVVHEPGRGFNGLDRLATSDDGGYDWCGDGCFKAIDPDCIGQCKRRHCPLREDLD